MSLFISYSRQDAPLVRRLHEALAARGRETWVDWEGIPPSAEWMREIEAAIDAAEAVVFLLSPASAASAVCRQEVAHAGAGNKRLLPVVCADVSPAHTPDALARLNWIWMRPGDDFAAAVETLLQAVDTDLDWVRAHTRLLVRAVEWQARAQDVSLALRGTDLLQAEQWLMQGPQRSPAPTELQTRYILESRRQAAQRRFRLLAAGTATLVSMAVLGTLFVVQRQATAMQAQVASARRLAAVSERLRVEPGFEANRTPSPTLSLQLAAEATRRALAAGNRSLEVDLALRRALAVAAQALPLPPPAEAPGHAFEQLVFTGQRLLAAAAGPLVTSRWDAAGLTAVGGSKRRASADQVALSPDGSFMATVGFGQRPGAVELWEADAEEPLARLPELDGQVDALAVMPGGSHVAVSSSVFDSHTQGWSPPRTRVWRRSSSRFVAELPGVGQPVFSPDGLHLVASRGDELVVWTLSALQAGARSPGTSLGAGDLPLFSPDGRHMAMRRGPGFTVTEVWRTADWSRASELPAELPVALGPGGRLLAWRGLDDKRTLHIAEVSSQREIARLATPQENAPAAFSPDGQRIAVGALARVDAWRLMGGGGALPAADAASAGGSADAPAHTAAHTSAGTPAAGAASATTSAAPSPTTTVDIAVLEGGNAMLLTRDADAPGGGSAAARAPGGADTDSVTHEFSARRWLRAGADGAAPRAVKLGLARLGALAADGRRAALAKGRQLRVVDTGSAATLASVTLPAEVTTLAISIDGQQVAAATTDGTLHLLPVKAPQQIVAVARPGREPLARLAVSPDGQGLTTVVTTASSRSGAKLSVELRRPANGTVTARTPTASWELDRGGGGMAALLCGLSPDGERVATVTRDSSTRVRVRAARDGRDLLTVNEPGETPRCAFSTDGQTLAIGSQDGTVRLWDLATQSEVGRIEGAEPVTHLALDATGRWLATIDDNAAHDDGDRHAGSARVWPVGQAELLAQACEWLLANLSIADWAQHLGAQPYAKACPGNE